MSVCLALEKMKSSHCSNKISLDTFWSTDYGKLVREFMEKALVVSETQSIDLNFSGFQAICFKVLMPHP